LTGTQIDTGRDGAATGFGSDTIGVMRAAGKFGAGTALSRILGVLRDMLKAYLFGTGTAADAFTVAFRIPNMLRAFLAEGTLSASFVPVFNDYLATGRKKESWEVARHAFGILAIVLLAVSVLGVLLAPFIVRVMASGFGQVPGKIELTVTLTQILFPYIFFVGLTALCAGILNSHRHFTMPALAPAVLNICMIAFMGFLCTRIIGGAKMQIYGLAAGALVGGAGQLLIQIPILKKKGMPMRPGFDFRHPAIGRIFKLMIPGILGMGVAEINAFVDTYLAALLEPGSVSALEYGNRLIQLPLGIFGVALGTAALPTMSAQAARDELESLKKTLDTNLRMIVFVMAPATVGLIVMRVPIVRLLFERGRFFGGDSVSFVTSALMFYAIGLIAYGAAKSLVAAFYSMKDTKTPVRCSVVAMITNIILNLILMRYLQLGGLALATALSSMLNVGLLLKFLIKRIGDVFGPGLGLSLAKSVVAALAMGVVTYWCRTWVFSWAGPLGGMAKIYNVGIPVVVGIASYAFFSILLRSQELRLAWASVSRKSRGL
jgi:putative peptidoglycan lipid II flippase